MSAYYINKLPITTTQYNIQINKVLILTSNPRWVWPDLNALENEIF